MQRPYHRSNEGAAPLAFESVGWGRGPMQSAPHNLVLMDDSPFCPSLGSLPFGRLKNGVVHRERRFNAGVRTANAEVQPEGDRGRSASLSDNDHHLTAIFLIGPNQASQ